MPRIKVDAAYMKSQYDIIYAAEDIIHPKRGRLIPYGSGSSRDGVFLKFIQDNLRPGSSVLDASCGRGRLLRMLLEEYDIEGTEIVESLFREGGSLYDLPVIRVDYASIRTVCSERVFDAVISNDVLEHLVGVEAVRQAMRDLASLSREYLLVSVGLKSAPTYCTALNLEPQQLHRVRKPAEWWRAEFEEHAKLIEDIEAPGHWTGFGLVHETT